MLSPETAGVIAMSDESIEKKVYNIVNDLSEYLPLVNDRNRLGFDLYKYVIGEGDEPLTAIKNAKVELQGISLEDISKRISVEINKIKIK